MRPCRYMLIFLLFQLATLNGAPDTNPTGHLLFTQTLESHFSQEVFSFLAVKQQETERVERIETTISRLQVEIFSNSTHKNLAELQLKKIAAYLEREVNNAQREKLSVLHQIDALKTKKIQFEMEGCLAPEDAIILRRYVDLFALRVAFLNQKIRIREKFLAAIHLETMPEKSEKKSWQAFAFFVLTSMVLAGIRYWTVQ